jgi:hypothetical protein
MKGLLKEDKRRRRIVLAGLFALTCVLGTRGIRDESSVMLSGDMARYVMNAVFVRDLIADGGASSYDDVARYAERYYAKYPALSLGHHPPIAYLSIVPFFWIFGVTLIAVRMAALAWFLLATWGLYSVAKRLFSWQVAAWASALFVTNVFVLRAGQYLLSEMPMTALALWSVHALLRFCDLPSASRFVAFATLVAASVYAKQLAILMLPVYFTILGVRLGWRRLLNRRALAAGAFAAALILPMAVMTVALSPMSFAIAVWNSTRLVGGHRTMTVSRIVSTIISTHLSVLAMFLTAASSVVLVLRRRRDVWIPLVWIVSVVGGSVVFAAATEPARYAFGALPAYALLIGALAGEANSRTTKTIVTALLTATLGWQLWNVRNVYPSGAGGYETAAKYVLAQASEPAILYDSWVDTGYFVFFVRQNDPSGEHIVVRSDKIIGKGPVDLEQGRADMHATLQRLGVRWIVAEERHNGPKMLRMFHEEFAGPRFALRQQIPVVSTAAPGLNLLVYEYLDAKTPDYDATISIDLPLGKRDFALRLRDLVKPR